MKDYWDQKADRAYNAYAASFVEETKAAYRACKSIAELEALAKLCYRKRDEAARRGNAVANMTRHGTHAYDSWDALYVEADNLGRQLWRKVYAVRNGEPLQSHLHKSAVVA